MIKKLHLKNFKSHRDTMLDFNPLTLISGVNNIGKSSVLQSLLLLRQTYKNHRLEKGLDLSCPSPIVSLGIGNEVLYKYADKPILSIGVTTEECRYVFDFNAETALDESFLPISSSPIDTALLANESLFNNNFQYLSALRIGGKSDFKIYSYEVNDERQISIVNGQGEALGNYLFSYGGESTYNYLSTGKTEESLPLLDQVVYWESMISKGITITVEKKTDNTGFSITFGTKGSEGKKSIEGLRAENVGFGVSYSLSVVTALLSAKPGALIMIENPEAHLHPEGQSKLAELMCLVAQRGIQVIVETHSDHIINGVLVNCKRFEKEGYGIDRENVSIYYFGGQDENHAVQYEEIKIIPDGKIEFQPIGFFDRIEKDIDYILEG